jgi:ElaB/YqjD/DUF883 family membrane-anchored ribosome-binding protein
MARTPQKLATHARLDARGENEKFLEEVISELSSIGDAAESIRSEADGELAASQARCERAERVVARSQRVVPSQR